MRPSGPEKHILTVLGSFVHPCFDGKPRLLTKIVVIGGSLLLGVSRAPILGNRGLWTDSSLHPGANIFVIFSVALSTARISTTTARVMLSSRIWSGAPGAAQKSLWAVVVQILPARIIGVFSRGLIFILALSTAGRRAGEH